MINQGKSRGSKILPRPGIEPQSPSSQSVALTIKLQRPPQDVWFIFFPQRIPNKKIMETDIFLQAWIIDVYLICFLQKQIHNKIMFSNKLFNL